MTWGQKLPVLLLFSQFSIYDILILCFAWAHTTEKLQVSAFGMLVQLCRWQPTKQTPAHTRAYNTNVQISLNLQKRNVLKKFISSHIFKQFQSALFRTFLLVTAKPHANLLHVPSYCWEWACIHVGSKWGISHSGLRPRTNKFSWLKPINKR